MRGTFREWYAPTPEELARLWSEATFVLDSNVLLDLYQYPEGARNEFLGILDQLKDRLWLPYQAGLEYQRNRQGCLPQQRKVLETLISSIEDLVSRTDRLGVPEYHPVLHVDRFEERRTSAHDALESLAASVREDLDETPSYTGREVLEGDDLRDRLTVLFDSKVGEQFSPEDLQTIYLEGKSRFADSIPPGFKDVEKAEPQRYNDLVIWKEVLRAAKARGDKATIFVTNDRKEDWWLRKADSIIGPRPELIREYMDETQGEFYMYTPGGFLETARAILGLEVSEGTIDAVDRVSLASRAEDFLRFQRMALPECATRHAALGRIYDAVQAGAVQTADDLNSVIESLGPEFRTSYCSVPLFFALVREEYGPLCPEYDPDLRLRDRRVYAPACERDDFVRRGDAAWLAQALYRLRYANLSDAELMECFFGEDYDEVDAVLFANATECMQRDLQRKRSSDSSS